MKSGKCELTEEQKKEMLPLLKTAISIIIALIRIINPKTPNN